MEVFIQFKQEGNYFKAYLCTGNERHYMGLGGLLEGTLNLKDRSTGMVG